MEHASNAAPVGNWDVLRPIPAKGELCVGQKRTPGAFGPGSSGSFTFIYSLFALITTGTTRLVCAPDMLITVGRLGPGTEKAVD
jgi:hypothetical protein